ncbi:MAG: leucine-rich repeat domain-containing protein, partial [Prevotella sp.]|nr:leucine-rich repeat domain-containing protein [Prevotella sp.]
ATMTVDAGNTKYDSRNGCNAIIEKETNTLIAGCKNTKIPDDVTSIGDYAFAGCDGLTTFTIPASVTSIGFCAFKSCTGLTTITIPACVTTIGDQAFSGCDGLTTVTIGSGVTYIGYDAFYLCTNVTDVYCYAVPDALTWDEGGCDDFMDGKATKCHVTDADTWSAMFTDVNVDFEGDLAPKAKTKAAGAEYWSSYYNSIAHLEADDNTTVYKATLSGTTVTLTEISDKVITAGQAVLLKTTTKDPVELTPCATGSTDDYSGNDLEGVDEDTAKESGFDYYVLSYQDSKLSFYKYSGTTLGANKAFFKIPANSSREFLDILGEVTGIDGRWKMEDGRSDVYYDLNGRRVMNPTKGIYIVNGSKVVVK